MSAFLQYALSPFPRRRSRSTISKLEKQEASIYSDPIPPASPGLPPKPTRSIGVQTPVLERRTILPGGATPVLGRRSISYTKDDSTKSTESLFSFSSPSLTRKNLKKHQDSFLKGLNLTPALRRKRTPVSTTTGTCSNGNCSSFVENDLNLTPVLSRRRATLTSAASSVASSCSTLVTDPHTIPPTPTPSETPTVHIVQVGEAGMGISRRDWEQLLSREDGKHRNLNNRDSVYVAQCAMWQCLPVPVRKKHQSGMFDIFCLIQYTL